jgi:hypothetical protein
MRWLHLVMIIIWVLLAIPTALWWSNSVLWVGEMSVYACAGIHVSAFFSSRADKRIKDQQDQ